MPVYTPFVSTEWMVQTNVYVPASVTFLEAEAPPGSVKPATSLEALAVSPGLSRYALCGKDAVASGKLKRTVSPVFIVIALCAQRSPEASTSTVLAAGPPADGSSAENLTVTGPVYVLLAPGAAGSRVCVVTGARWSLFCARIVNVTVLAVSTLPSASVER